MRKSRHVRWTQAGLQLLQKREQQPLLDPAQLPRKINQQTDRVSDYLETPEGQAGKALLRFSGRVVIIHLLPCPTHRKLCGLDADGFLLALSPHSDQVTIPRIERPGQWDTLAMLLTEGKMTASMIIKKIRHELDAIASQEPVATVPSRSK